MKRSPQQANSRLGLWLCAVYGAIYSAFVAVNAFAPELAAWQPLAGLNLALWWGLALIALACGLAVAYGVACQPEPAAQPAPPSVAPAAAKDIAPAAEIENEGEQ